MLIRLDEAFCLLSERLKALAEGRAVLVATANRPYALVMASSFALHHQDPDALLLGVVTEESEALQLLDDVHQPVLAFVSERLEAGSGLTLVERLKALSGPDRCISTILTLTDLSGSSIAAARQSSSDVLLTQRGLDLLGILHAVDAIVHGERYVDPVLRYAVQYPELEVEDLLSLRERSVLSLVCEGLTNREIGESLQIAETTARGHVQSIIRKLHVRDRTSAAVEGIRRHWVD